MISEELIQRKAAVCASLLNLSNECCGMSHHYTWKHDGHELPVCGNGRPEKLMGCAHGDNLSLRAAVVLVAELGLISDTDKSALISFLNISRESLWMIDLDAIDVGDNISLEVRRQVAFNLKADLNLPQTIEVALQTEQKKVVDSLDLLRQSLLTALVSECADMELLKKFIHTLHKHCKSIQIFQIAHQEFTEEVLRI